jgi:hypothetical protein
METQTGLRGRCAMCDGIRTAIDSGDPNAAEELLPLARSRPRFTAHVEDEDDGRAGWLFVGFQDTF